MPGMCFFCLISIRSCRNCRKSYRSTSSCCNQYNVPNPTRDRSLFVVFPVYVCSPMFYLHRQAGNKWCNKFCVDILALVLQMNPKHLLKFLFFRRLKHLQTQGMTGSFWKIRVPLRVMNPPVYSNPIRTPGNSHITLPPLGLKRDQIHKCRKLKVYGCVRK